MYLSEQEAKEGIIRYAESIFSRGLTAGASANMSVRIADGWVITPTNSCFGFLTQDTLSVLDRNGNVVRGNPPSKEFKIHRAMYDARPQDTCILHLHSSHATAWSCIPNHSPTDCIPSYTPYLTMRLGAIALARYFAPGDDKLAEEIAKLAPEYAGILMANHGPIVSAPDIEKCVYGMEELEESCKIALLLNTNGNQLSSDDIALLKTRNAKK